MITAEPACSGVVTLDPKPRSGIKLAGSTEKTNSSALASSATYSRTIK